MCAAMTSLGQGCTAVKEASRQKPHAPKPVLVPGCDSKSAPDAAPSLVAYQVSGDSSLDCVICWEAAASLVFQPCGHMCACANCVSAFFGPAFLCPMRRSEVASSIQV